MFAKWHFGRFAMQGGGKTDVCVNSTKAVAVWQIRPAYFLANLITQPENKPLFAKEMGEVAVRQIRFVFFRRIRLCRWENRTNAVAVRQHRLGCFPANLSKQRGNKPMLAKKTGKAAVRQIRLGYFSGCLDHSGEKR